MKKRHLKKEELEARVESAEEEVDELKNQLADYQQALDVQQTRAIQYRQAVQALERAKAQCDIADLDETNAEQWAERIKQKFKPLRIHCFLWSRNSMFLKLRKHNSIKPISW